MPAYQQTIVLLPQTFVDHKFRHLDEIVMNRANVAGPNQGDSIQSWYDDLPIITKILITGTLLQGAMVSFGMLNPMNIVLWWPQVTHNKLLRAFN